MDFFNVITDKNAFKVFYDSKFVDKDKIKVDKPLFFKMCKEGCVNFNQKYSCPPFSPNFKDMSKDKEGLFVTLFLLNLDEIDSTEYNKIRIANVVMKSKLDRLMRYLEEKFKINFLSMGSCRLCKPCKCKLKLPCKYPDKRKYSLEATGIDCDSLAQSLFNKRLLWYKEKKAPEYTCVLAGILCNKKEVGKLKKELQNYIQN